MPYERTIVCLAASIKHGGLCIAGRVYEDDSLGEWIRPIGHRSSHEIKYYEVRKNNGEPTMILDVVTMTLDAPKPSGHQSENHLISEAVSWRHEGRFTYEKLLNCLDSQLAGIWDLQGVASDCVPARLASEFDHSMLLVRVVSLEITVNWSWGSKKWRGSFNFEGRKYDLAITDPWIRSNYQSGGTYILSEAILCLSLAAPYFKRQCYKLIASVITPDRN